MNCWQRILNDEDGATTIEYCVVLFFIITACLVGISAVGSSNSGLWGRNLNELNGVM